MTLNLCDLPNETLSYILCRELRDYAPLLATVCSLWGDLLARVKFPASFFKLALRGDHTALVWVARVRGGKTPFNRTEVEHIACGAAAGGYTEIMCLAKSWGAPLDSAMYSAASHGQTSMVRLLRRWGASADCAMSGAAHAAPAAERHLKIVQLAGRWGATNINTAFISAAARGNAEVVAELIGQGADRRLGETAMHNAAREGFAATVRVLLAWDADPALGLAGLAPAARTGNLRLLRLLRKRAHQHPDFQRACDDALVEASRTGRVRAMKLLWAWGARSLDESLVGAAATGASAAVAQLIDWGAAELDDALLEAASNDNSETAQLLVERGAEDLWGAMLEAARCGGSRTMDVIETWAEIDYLSLLWEALECEMQGAASILLDRCPSPLPVLWQRDIAQKTAELGYTRLLARVNARSACDE